MENNMKIIHLVNSLFISVFVAVAGCAHSANNIKKEAVMKNPPTVNDIKNHSDSFKRKSFGETVFGFMVPGYSSGMIFGRTAKESELLEFIKSEFNNHNFTFLTVLYLTTDELSNLNKKIDVAEKKGCYINYITYKQNNDPEKTFILYYNIDGLLKMKVLYYDDALNEWRPEGDGTSLGP